jgi:hypothetical protein
MDPVDQFHPWLACGAVARVAVRWDRISLRSYNLPASHLIAIQYDQRFALR